MFIHFSLNLENGYNDVRIAPINIQHTTHKNVSQYEI